MTLYKYNPGNKSWHIYVKEITSILGDDLKLLPYENNNLILETSGSGKIQFNENGITYNLADLSNNELNNELNNVPIITFGDTSLNGTMDSVDKFDRGLNIQYYYDPSYGNTSSGDISENRNAFMGLVTANDNSNSSYYNKFILLRDVSLVDNRIIFDDSSLGDLVINYLLAVDASFTNMDVSGNTKLQTLLAIDASFTNLDVSGNTTLKTLLAVDASFTGNVNINGNLDAKIIKNTHSSNFINFLTPINLTGSIAGSLLNSHNCICSKYMHVPGNTRKDFITITINRNNTSQHSEFYQSIFCKIDYTVRTDWNGIGGGTIIAPLGVVLYGSSPPSGKAANTLEIYDPLVVTEGAPNDYKFDIVNGYGQWLLESYFTQPNPIQNGEVTINIYNPSGSEYQGAPTIAFWIYATIYINSSIPILFIS